MVLETMNFWPSSDVAEFCLSASQQSNFPHLFKYLPRYGYDKWSNCTIQTHLLPRIFSAFKNISVNLNLVATIVAKISGLFAKCAAHRQFTHF